MHSFAVWAPRAKTLALHVDGVRYAMPSPDAGGWWRLDVAGAGPGSRYGYCIDGEPLCMPDPRSLDQPDGVHALSRVYDQHAFSWSDAGFQPQPLPSAVLYELHVGTFTAEGTLDAAIARLDALAMLGITHVELMPVAAFAGRYGWGYDGVALYAVHAPYGGPDALKRFVNAAHGKGLAVLLDVVYNHFGPVGNYAGRFGPYLTGAHNTPWGGAVNLEGRGADEVRRFFCDNAAMWLRDFHIDGLRLDAVHALVDRSAIHFLEQFAIAVEALSASLGKRLVLIAESDLNDPRIVTPHEAGGFGLDAQWSDDFQHALFAVLSRTPQGGCYRDFGSLAQLAKALERTFVYDGIFSQYRGRTHGRSAAHLSQHRFLGYSQTHDQVGNRAVGDRIAEVVGCERARIAAALVLTAPFVPMLFQGEEWAASSPFQYFADHDDPEIARQVREGRRREFAAFGWNPEQVPDPEDAATFQRSKLNWDEAATGAHAAMRAWYRALIQLRRATPCLNDGEPGHTQVVFSEPARWLHMRRGHIHVVCNLSESVYACPLPAASRLLLASNGAVTLAQDTLTLPPDTVGIADAGA